MHADFELLLFTTNTSFANECLSAGIDAIIIDWENQGKHERQKKYDTQINQDSYDDLITMRKAIDGNIICRINQYTNTSNYEIQKAIEGGADEILLPMVKTVDQVEAFVNTVNNQVKCGILIETKECLNILPKLAHFQLHRMYIGLNDLQISKGTPNLFYAFVDGTVKEIKQALPNAKLGLGGITHPDYGYPLLCKKLINYYVQHGMQFSFLRRSFNKIVEDHGIENTIKSIKAAIETAKQISSDEQKQNYLQLEAQIKQWQPNNNLTIEQTITTI